VLDGGTGSNFLVGGTGSDTFFTDARGALVVWNTLNNFHAGDMATLWGFVQGVSSYYWEASPAGAPGATGATLRADIVGGAGRDGSGIDASVTFAGLSVAQAQKLVVSTGTQAAGSYLFLSNPGV
jgi:Ca2+-binding RTX toxin-like protein